MGVSHKFLHFLLANVVSYNRKILSIAVSLESLLERADVAANNSEAGVVEGHHAVVIRGITR